MKTKFAVAIAAMIVSVAAGAQTSSAQSGQANITPNPPIGTGTIDTDQAAPGVHNGSSNNTSNSSMAKSRSSKAQRSKSSGSSGTAGCAGGTGNKGGASNAGNADGSVGGNPDCRSASDQTKRSVPPASVGQTNAGTANGSDNDPARK